MRDKKTIAPRRRSSSVFAEVGGTTLIRVTRGIDGRDEPRVGGGPRRGRPARIGRQQIIAAARAIPPQELTMKAVADALGVDRKALHRHVGDRDQLLQRVVMDSFEAEIRRIELPDDADWRAILRAHGQALRDGVRSLGAIAGHVRSLLQVTMRSGDADSVLLPWTERVLQALISAGLAVNDAARVLALVSSAAVSSVYDTGAPDRSPQTEIGRALMAADQPEFPALLQIIAGSNNAPAPDGDLHFALDVIIAGLDSHLSTVSAPE